MPKTASASVGSVPKKSRRTQERTEITRGKILEAAVTLFSERGFEGVSIRDVENMAGVQRGLAAYHFGDKAGLWKCAADAIFGLMKREFDQRLEILQELSERERLAFIIRFYVRFHDRHPELSRLMSREATRNDWPLRYLVEHHIRPASQKLQKLVADTLALDEAEFVRWYYVMVSASSTVFSFAPECQLLFDTDAHDEAFVEAHADMLVGMLLGRG